MQSEGCLRRYEHKYQDASEGAGEVAVWALEVRLSEIGKASMTLDDLYASEMPSDKPEKVEVGTDLLAYHAERDYGGGDVL